MHIAKKIDVLVIEHLLIIDCLEDESLRLKTTR